MNYTLRERTVKNSTINDAIRIAKIRLKGIPICLSSVREHMRQEDELYTIQEINEIADTIYDESISWS